MSDYLPKECLIEILIRVPLKSLLRFRCVSKTWHTLISSPLFINTHLNHQKASHRQKDHDQIILFRHYSSLESPGSDDDYGLMSYNIVQSEECFALHRDDDSFPHNPILKLKPHHNGWEDYFSIVGSMNGIVCLADRTRCYFWNISLNKTVSVIFESGFPVFRQTLGFSFDPITNDLKLVRLHYNRSVIEYSDVPPLVDVFSLGTNSWRQVSSPGPMYIVKQSSSSPLAFVSGSFHWVAHSPTSSRFFRNVIVAFNMADEVFHEIAVPNCLVTKTYLNMTVVMLNGLLCLVPDNYSPSLDSSYDSNSVWIMKEYGVADSWNKLFDINLGDERTNIHRVITFRKNGELLLIGGSNQLLSYQPYTQETKDLSFGTYVRTHYDTSSYKARSYFIDSHMESLLLLNAPNED